MKKQTRRWAVVGHSLGGSVALRLTQTAPERASARVARVDGSVAGAVDAAFTREERCVKTGTAVRLFAAAVSDVSFVYLLLLMGLTSLKSEADVQRSAGALSG